MFKKLAIIGIGAASVVAGGAAMYKCKKDMTDTANASIKIGIGIGALISCGVITILGGAINE